VPVSLPVDHAARVHRYRPAPKVGSCDVRPG
jgi:hypothetical protein